MQYLLHKMNNSLYIYKMHIYISIEVKHIIQNLITLLLTIHATWIHLHNQTKTVPVHKGKDLI